jgi:hypothetical protein
VLNLDSAGPVTEGDRRLAQKLGLLEKTRAEMPATRFLSPLYRSPVRVATSGAERGSVIKFRY